jgi:hypothetical protein
MKLEIIFRVKSAACQKAKQEHSMNLSSLTPSTIVKNKEKIQSAVLRDVRLATRKHMWIAENEYLDYILNTKPKHTTNVPSICEYTVVKFVLQLWFVTVTNIMRRDL